MVSDKTNCFNHHRRPTFAVFLNSVPSEEMANDEDDYKYRRHSDSSTMTRDVDTPGELSPYSMSPLINRYDLSPSPLISGHPSPFVKSPWNVTTNEDILANKTGLIGTIFRQEGHVYSLAAAGSLLYTGSESKNIRVWKNLQDFSGFKSNSGFVKAIVISGDRIFTGHQDGKIRVWKVKGENSSKYKRVGTLPTFIDSITKSLNPNNYVETRRHKNMLKIRHFDAISCLSLDRAQGLLYSSSWDKTLKVWRLSDSRCLESLVVHDDAVNAVAVAGFDSLVFTGSADGTVKAWRRMTQGGRTKHILAEVLWEGETAVTALATVCEETDVVYAGLSDGTVSFWAREKLSQRPNVRLGGILRGHKMAVLCLAASGKIILSGSADRSICVWRRGAGGVHVWMSMLADHKGPVKCVAMSEEENSEESGRRWIVYSGSLDNTVKVWRVAEDSR